MQKFCAGIDAVNSSNNLSEQEFQEVLNSWFEGKGLLKNLRTQLRVKMVSALKNTSVESKDIMSNFHQISLSKQAMHILIAEYLMQNKCHYSLSVFNTEVPLTRILPDFSEIIKNGKMLNGAYHFNKANVLNIIELIGIEKNSIHCEEVLALYFSELEENSLLSCVIKLLCKLSNDNVRLCNLHLENAKDLNVNNEVDNENNFIKQVVNYLKSLDLSGEKLKIVMEYINSLHEKELKDKDEKYSRIMNDLKNQINNQEKQRREMLKTNKMLRNQLSKITKDYKKLSLYTKNLTFYEKALKRHRTRNKSNIDLIANLTNNSNENKPVSYFDVKVNNDMGQQQHCRKVRENGKSPNVNLLKHNRNVTEENKREKEQHEKLTIKYKQVISEFTECQQHISLLHSKLNEGYFEELFENILWKDNPTCSVDLRNNMDAVEFGSEMENILHQTRLRMQQLEEETKKNEDKCEILHFKSIII